MLIIEKKHTRTKKKLTTKTHSSKQPTQTTKANMSTAEVEAKRSRMMEVGAEVAKAAAAEKTMSDSFTRTTGTAQNVEELQEAFRNEMKAYFPAEVNELIDAHGFPHIKFEYVGKHTLHAKIQVYFDDVTPVEYAVVDFAQGVFLTIHTNLMECKLPKDVTNPKYQVQLYVAYFCKHESKLTDYLLDLARLENPNGPLKRIVRSVQIL